MIKRGSTKQKILLLMLGGLALSLNRSPSGHLRIYREVKSEWSKINKRALYDSIRALYKSNLISQYDNRDGTVTFVLSKNGKKVALRYNLDEIVIPRVKWDKKWRIVMFDIPERLKKIRESLRYHLKRVGFIELQRSVFVFPFDCKKEIEYILEFYNIKKFVSIVVAHEIDNELHLKNKFDLI